MNKGKIGGILTCIAAVLMIGAVKFWAPVCQKSLQLADGGECHMKCFYYGQIMLYMGILLLAEGLVLLLAKQARSAGIIGIVTGLLMLLLTNSNLGIGVCAGTSMMCRTTALWGRISAITAIAGGILPLPGQKNPAPQAR